MPSYKKPGASDKGQGAGDSTRDSRSPGINKVQDTKPSTVFANSAKSPLLEGLSDQKLAEFVIAVVPHNHNIFLDWVADQPDNIRYLTVLAGDRSRGLDCRKGAMEMLARLASDRKLDISSVIPVLDNALDEKEFGHEITHNAMRALGNASFSGSDISVILPKLEHFLYESMDALHLGAAHVLDVALVNEHTRDAVFDILFNALNSKDPVAMEAAITVLEQALDKNIPIPERFGPALRNSFDCIFLPGKQYSPVALVRVLKRISKENAIPDAIPSIVHALVNSRSTPKSEFHTILINSVLTGSSEARIQLTKAIRKALDSDSFGMEMAENSKDYTEMITIFANLMRLAIDAELRATGSA